LPAHRESAGDFTKLNRQIGERSGERILVKFNPEALFPGYSSVRRSDARRTGRWHNVVRRPAVAGHKSPVTERSRPATEQGGVPHAETGL